MNLSIINFVENAPKRVLSIPDLLIKEGTRPNSVIYISIEQKTALGMGSIIYAVSEIEKDEFVSRIRAFENNIR